MKTLIKLSVIFALFLTSGCTFDTDIDADFDFNDPFASEDDKRCDSIRVLAEAESDEATRDELAAAYDRCLHSDAGTERDGQPADGDRDGDQWPDGDDGADADDCETVETRTEDGEVYEERQCRPSDGDPNDDGTSSRPFDCQDVIDVVGDHANDPDTDWLQVCADFGLTHEECLEIMDQCLDRYDATDPDRPGDEQGDGDSTDSTSDLDCDRVVEELEQAGYDVPLDDVTAQELYEVCVDGMANQDLDPEMCEQVILCAT